MSEQNGAFPVCTILGVNIAAVNMEETLAIIDQNLSAWSGEYICVSNVHTTVTAYEEPDYLAVQNGAVMALPDGKPLSVAARRRGFENADRVTGPDLMGEIFKLSAARGYRHYFYGASEDTLSVLREKLLSRYPGISIVGMVSPPFRPLTEEEDAAAVEAINAADADFVWIGLGAPKQEKWMAAHKGRVKGLMIGVGAGFDFHADKIKRAPRLMQKLSLEWLYRLMQDPKRLFRRYLHTNPKYLRLVKKENKLYRK